MVSENSSVRTKWLSDSIASYKTLAQMLKDNANDILHIRTNASVRFLLKWVKRMKFMYSDTVL